MGETFGMTKFHSTAAYKRIVASALADGASQHNHTTVRWDISGNCSNPVYRELRTIPQLSWEAEVHRELTVGTKRQRSCRVRPGSLHTLEYEVRCRQCANCLKVRGTQWWIRAKSECQRARRTWFITFTLRPSEHYRVEAIARKELKSAKYDLLSDAERLQARHNIVNKWLTLYLKRLRKQTGAQLRYLLVLEIHKSGLPHYHMLMHEVDQAITYRSIRDQWPHGFSDAKLVDEKAAGYVTKYISKSALARVRASAAYGK